MDQMHTISKKKNRPYFRGFFPLKVVVNKFLLFFFIGGITWNYFRPYNLKPVFFNNILTDSLSYLMLKLSWMY